VKDGDNYCSFCGHKFFSLDVSIAPSRFQHEDLPPPASLVIENRSTQNEVTIERIVSRQRWVSLDLSAVAFPLVLKPLQKKVIDVTVEPLDADDEYAAATIEVESTAGSEKVSVEVLPAPDLEIDTGEYEIFLDELNLEATFATITLNSGVVTVKRIVAEPEEWVKIELVDDLSFPIQLDARGRKKLETRLIMDERKLRQLSQSFPAMHEGVVRVICDEFERAEPFRAKCWKPAELTIWEAGHQFEVLLGRPSKVTLTLQNKEPRDATGGKGNAALLIQSIRWETLDGRAVDWIHPAADLTYPIRIEGGTFHRIDFTVQTENATGLSEGRHSLRCVLETNTVNGQEVARCDIKARPVSIYDGVLAIDFGTSNTCCAILHRKANDHEMIPLDAHNSAKPTTAPTVSYYLSEQANGSRNVNIGVYADQLAAEPKVVQSTVRSPKRYLGKTKDEHPFEVRFSETREYTTLSTQQVVTDFLLQVKHAAEEKGQATFRRFIITHPARFRTGQLKDLRAAVTAAFGKDCDVTTLQEPVASALAFIVSGKETIRDRYVLGVFDFGGGTTDLSLLLVTNSRIEHLLSIEVQVVASTGKWFGGEDLTYFILNKALEKAKQVLPQMKIPQPAELLSDEHPLMDQSMVLMARTNRLRLWQWSELVKPLLFDKGQALTVEDLPFRLDLFPELKLQTFTPAGAADVGFQFDILKPNSAEVLAYLETELRVLCAMLRGLVQRSTLNKLDCLLMSGKSSAISRVGAVLQEEFPETEIIRSEEPKECVVRGACILEKIGFAGDVELSIVGGKTTISRLGLEGNEEGQMVFREWIAAGVPIPPEGLIVSRAYLFTRQAIEVLENDGDEIWRNRMKVQNPNIETQGVYDLVDPPEWLPSGPRKTHGRLDLRISPEYEVSLTGHIDGCPEPLLYRYRT
jgi:PAS domain-containing protein